MDTITEDVDPCEQKYEVTAGYACKIPRVPSEENVYVGPDQSADLRNRYFRVPAHHNKMATIFDADDPTSYCNWLTSLGVPDPIRRRTNKPMPRVRELNDPQAGVLVFEMTGVHDGSISIKCPPICDATLGESFEVINFIMNDIGAYSSIEIDVLTIDRDNVMRLGRNFMQDKKIVARNFRSRPTISESVLKVPMRLMEKMSYVYLDLTKLVKQAWGVDYLQTQAVKINANIRIRRVFFSEKVFRYDELPHAYRLKPHFRISMQNLLDFGKTKCPMWRLRDTDSHKQIIRRLQEEADYERKHHTQHYVKKTGIPAENRVRATQLSVPSKRSHGEPLFQILTRAVMTCPDDYEDGMSTSKGSMTDTEIEASEYPLISVQQYSGSGIGINYNEGEAKQEFMQDWRAKDPSSAQSLEDHGPPVADFCLFLNKLEDPESTEEAEWDTIMNFDTTPQTLSIFQRQLQGEGLYDIFHAKMVHQNDPHFYDQKKKSSVVKEEMETIMPSNAQELRRSMIDAESDWHFLANTNSIYNNVERVISEEYDGEGAMGWDDMDGYGTPDVCRSDYIPPTTFVEEEEIEEEEFSTGEEELPQVKPKKKKCYENEWLTWKCQGATWEKTLLLHQKMLESATTAVTDPKEAARRRREKNLAEDEELTEIEDLVIQPIPTITNALTPDYFKNSGKLTRFVETVLASYCCKTHIVRS